MYSAASHQVRRHAHHGAPQPVALARMGSNAAEPNFYAREWENNHCDGGQGDSFWVARLSLRGEGMAETSCALVDRAKWSLR